MSEFRLPNKDEMVDAVFEVDTNVKPDETNVEDFKINDDRYLTDEQVRYLGPRLNMNSEKIVSGGFKVKKANMEWRRSLRSNTSSSNTKDTSVPDTHVYLVASTLEHLQRIWIPVIMTGIYIECGITVSSLLEGSSPIAMDDNEISIGAVGGFYAGKMKKIIETPMVREIILCHLNKDRHIRIKELESAK